jgi:hypothetical protein
MEAELGTIKDTHLSNKLDIQRRCQQRKEIVPTIPLARPGLPGPPSRFLFPRLPSPQLRSSRVCPRPGLPRNPGSCGSGGIWKGSGSSEKRRDPALVGGAWGGAAPLRPLLGLQRKRERQGEAGPGGGGRSLRGRNHKAEPGARRKKAGPSRGGWGRGVASAGRGKPRARRPIPGTRSSRHLQNCTACRNPGRGARRRRAKGRGDGSVGTAGVRRPRRCRLRGRRREFAPGGPG